MTLHVRDTENRLQPLEALAKRTRLFLDHLNSKFHHKTVRVDRQEGLVAETDGGKPRCLPLDSLSSGERHELVLHYDLLFRVPPNTIVLLDEPERSLHLSWQRTFLRDLLKIIEVADFDALIATHSPGIVNDRDDLMVGIGDPV